jgi:DNA-binding response OmpR family regulator
MTSWKRRSEVSPKTVLIVDDEPDLRSALYWRIKCAGYDVKMAANGEQGLQIANAEQPDLIITDVEMPGMNGHEMVRKLRSSWSTDDIPVIFLTAHGDFEEMKATLEKGADRYITKPANTEFLLITINTLIEEREARLKKAEQDELDK